MSGTSSTPSSTLSRLSYRQFFSSTYLCPRLLNQHTGATHTKWEAASAPIDSSLPEVERIRLRHAIANAKAQLDFRVNVFFKRETATGPFIPCEPGEEYILRDLHHTIACTPNAGQTTFNMWEPLSKKEKQARRQRRGGGGSDEDVDSDSELDDIDGEWEPDEDHPCMAPINRPSTLAPQPKPSPPTDFVPMYLRYPAPPPTNMIPHLPQPREIEYSGFIDLSPSSTLLGANTSNFFELPVDVVSNIYRDGYWGLKEWTLYPQLYDPHAPWLGYMGIDHSIF